MPINTRNEVSWEDNKRCASSVTQVTLGDSDVCIRTGQYEDPSVAISFVPVPSGSVEDHHVVDSEEVMDQPCVRIRVDSIPAMDVLLQKVLLARRMLVARIHGAGEEVKQKDIIPTLEELLEEYRPSEPDDGLEAYTTGTGQKLRVHKKEVCKGEFCPIHNPSDHHMKDWPTHWRSDKGIMERICEHEIGHPDPDEYKLGEDPSLAVHGCDGCCSTEPLNEVKLEK